MDDCFHGEGSDGYKATSWCSDGGGSDDSVDDFERQEFEWALYSQIHHEEVDGCDEDSKSWLQQECDVSITEGEEMGKNRNKQCVASVPMEAITDASELRSGAKGKTKKTSKENSTKRAHDSVMRPRKKKKASKEDTVGNLEELLIPTRELGKKTSTNKKDIPTADVDSRRKKQKPKDCNHKQKTTRKIVREVILLSSDESDSVDASVSLADGLHQPQQTSAQHGDGTSSESDSDYDFGAIQEMTDIRLNIDGSDTLLDNPHVTVADIHNSLGGESPSLWTTSRAD